MQSTRTNPIRGRGWCFTINNPESGELESIEYVYYETAARYTCYQLEKGGNCATPHIQGYIYWDVQKSFKFVKQCFPRAHLEFAKGTGEENKAYCSKDEGRLEGPWELGDIPVPGKRTDLLEIQEKLDQGVTLETIAVEHFSSFVRYNRGFSFYQMLTAPKRDWTMEILVIWGESGVGKSRYCHDNYPGGYWKSKNSGKQQFWDGYQGEDTVIIDEFYGWLPWDYLLRLTDRYPWDLDSKHGTLRCSAKTIIFTSNRHPKDWYDYAKLHVPEWDAVQSNGVPKNPLRRRISRVIELTFPLDDLEENPRPIKKEKIQRIAEEGNLWELYKDM